VVSVLEGAVEVQAADAVRAVHANQTWPPGGEGANPAAGRALLALSAPPVLVADGSGMPADAAVVLQPIDADEPVDGPAVDAAPDAGDTAQHVRVRPPVAPAIKDRWRTARLLRGQGQFAAAVTECLAIADAHDPVWSPIALVEAVRIELGPLADPERVIALADRVIREWPADALVSEARELRCRAARQLGRDGECARAPQP
jgi:hypothetical protein